MKPDDWPVRVKHLLKTELKRRRITYSGLADKLAKIGIEENEKNIAKKISRGCFKAVFLFQCLEAIGCESLHL
jgi:3-mercaptopyruvate sulfurtransferase SseA